MEAACFLKSNEIDTAACILANTMLGSYRRGQVSECITFGRFSDNLVGCITRHSGTKALKALWFQVCKRPH